MRWQFAIISMSVFVEAWSFPKPSSVSRICFSCVLCLCVSRVADDISLDLRLSALAASAFPALYSVMHTHTHTYKHVHTPLVSRYPVFPSPVTLSSWYCLSDSSWFVGVSVVTAQRPAPGDRDLSALSESWNQRWMARSHLCPELCALLVSPAPLHSLSQTLLLNRPIVGSLVLQKIEPNMPCYLFL